MLLSIIIPVYNGEKVIDNCITNIILNPYFDVMDIELLICNDGSTDKTAEKAQKYVNNKIKVFNQNNTGVSSARNLGLLNAKGKYIYFADADDYVDLNVLDEAVKLLEKKNIDLVVCDYVEKRGMNEKRISLELPPEEILKHNHIREILCNIALGNTSGFSTVWNKVYCSKLISQYDLKFDVNRTHGEDWYFNIQYISYIHSLYYYDEVLYYYINDGSQTWEKYSKSLDYCLITGHKTTLKLFQDLNIKEYNPDEYYKLYGRFFDQILKYLNLKTCTNAQKKAFLHNNYVRSTLFFIIRIPRERFNTLGLSRKRQAAAFLFLCNLYQLGLKFIE